MMTYMIIPMVLWTVWGLLFLTLLFWNVQIPNANRWLIQIEFPWPLLTLFGIVTFLLNWYNA